MKHTCSINWSFAQNDVAQAMHQQIQTRLINTLAEPNNSISEKKANFKTILSLNKDINALDTPSLPEPYTPQQLIKNLFSIPQATHFPSGITAETISTDSVPAHLLHWVEQLSLVQQQNQYYLQQNVLSQQNEHNVEVDLSLGEDEATRILVDNSHIIPLSTFNFTMHLQDVTGSRRWLLNLLDALLKKSDDEGLLPFKMSDKFPSSGEGFDKKYELVSLTEEARKVLVTTANFRQDMDDDFSLDNLYGFFITLRDDQSGFILKYDPDYAKKMSGKEHLALLSKPKQQVLRETENGSYQQDNSTYHELADQPIQHSFFVGGGALQQHSALFNNEVTLPKYPSKQNTSTLEDLWNEIGKTLLKSGRDQIAITNMRYRSIGTRTCN